MSFAINTTAMQKTSVNPTKATTTIDNPIIYYIDKPQAS